MPQGALKLVGPLMMGKGGHLLSTFAPSHQPVIEGGLFHP